VYLLASLITLQTLQNALVVIGYPAIFLFVFIECVGVPLPGETMVLLASFCAATTHQLQLPLVILFAALAAVLGDNVGYIIGRTGGRALVEKFGRFFFIKMEHLENAELFFSRHGAKTVFFGRFISLLRIWSAFLAGMNRMHWRTFLFYNGLGGIIWATYVGLLGYVAGRYFHDHFDQVERVARTIGWVGFGLVVLAIIVAVVVVKVRLARRAAVQTSSRHA
jgi:membrane protein DedA with SNARE-associated domain